MELSKARETKETKFDPSHTLYETLSLRNETANFILPRVPPWPHPPEQGAPRGKYATVSAQA